MRSILLVGASLSEPHVVCLRKFGRFDAHNTWQSLQRQADIKVKLESRNG